MNKQPSKANSLYQTLFNEYKLCENFTSGTQCQETFNVMWAEAKNRFQKNKTGLEQWAQEKILAYQQKRSLKKSTSIVKFLSPCGTDVNIYNNLYNCFIIRLRKNLIFRRNVLRLHL